MRKTEVRRIKPWVHTLKFAIEHYQYVVASRGAKFLVIHWAVATSAGVMTRAHLLFEGGR